MTVTGCYDISMDMIKMIFDGLRYVLQSDLVNQRDKNKRNCALDRDPLQLLRL